MRFRDDQAQRLPAQDPLTLGFGAIVRPRRGPRSWGKGSLAFVCLLTLGYSLLLNLSVVRGRSMAPGIHDGDRILVEPWLLAVDSVERGDVVVLRSPLEPELDYIKRVVGLPGEEVLVLGASVWIDGELLKEPYAIPDHLGSHHWVHVPDGYYYVLGDNRPRSCDSREFGLVPVDDLKGRVRWRVWPPERVGSLH